MVKNADWIAEGGKSWEISKHGEKGEKGKRYNIKEVNVTFFVIILKV